MPKIMCMGHGWAITTWGRTWRWAIPPHHSYGGRRVGLWFLLAECEGVGTHRRPVGIWCFNDRFWVPVQRFSSDCWLGHAQKEGILSFESFEPFDQKGECNDWSRGSKMPNLFENQGQVLGQQKVSVVALLQSKERDIVVERIMEHSVFCAQWCVVSSGRDRGLSPPNWGDTPTWTFQPIPTRKMMIVYDDPWDLGLSMAIQFQDSQVRNLLVETWSWEWYRIPFNVCMIHM